MHEAELEPKQATIWEGLAWAIVLAISFHWIEPFFHRFGNLDARYYEGNSILQFAIFNSRPFVITMGLLCAFAAWQYRLTWEQLGPVGSRLRFPMLAVVGCLLWLLLTVETNFWWGHAYWTERGLLAVVGAAVLFRPACIGMFVLLAYMLTGQFNEPFLYSWTDKLVIFQLGLVMLTYLVWRTVSFGRTTPSSAFIVMLAVLGQWYLVPAVGKIKIDWLNENNVAHLLSSARYQNGWLGWLSADTFGWVQRTLEQASPLLMASALIIELAVVLFLFSRRLSMVLLVSCALLHVGIFFSSGIFFWKWIVTEIALVVALSQIPKANQSQVFGWRPGLAACCLMCVMGYFSPRVVNLAWYDEPCAYRFRFEGTGLSGKQYELIAQDFAPYDLPFAQARFYFLTPREQLMGTFGTTQKREVHEFFKGSRSAQSVDLERIVKNHGLKQYSAEQALRMEAFLKRYVATANIRAASGYSIANQWLLKSPQHIQTRMRPDAILPHYQHQEPLRTIHVALEEHLLGDNHAQLVHHEELMSTDGTSLAERKDLLEIY